jgi:hypothetical protein
MWFDAVSNRRAVTLVACFVGLAACTADPAITTTAATPAPPTTTTTLVTSTEASTTTDTSTTTTTVPPVVDTYLTAGNTCLLGWWDGEWQSGDELPVRGGEPYQVVRLDDPISLTSGSGARPFCAPLDLVSVEFDPPLPGDFFELDALAIQTETDVRPSPVEPLGRSLPAYVEATSELLETRVPGIPIINLTQVIRTDLEGDGVDEVIVAASTIPDDLISSQVGDYSIVYLRKLIEGEVQTAILGESIVENLDNLFQNLVVFEVAAVADLNGDGKMEIVLNGTVWEGAFLQAWEYVNDDLGPVEVLGCGCGS